jgi:nickel/cobalt exporter
MPDFARFALTGIVFLLAAFAGTNAHAAGSSGDSAPARLILAQNAFPAPAGQPPRGFANPAGAAQNQPPAEPRGFAGRTIQWIIDAQTYFNREVVKALHAFKSQDPLAAGGALAALSFFYGVFHAVGPGHGVAIISTYVLANGQTVRRGLILAFLSSAAQAFTAIILVLLFSLILRAAGLQQQAARWLEAASFAIIAIVGAWMLFSAFRKYWPRKAVPAHTHDHGHEHGENCGCGHAHIPAPSDLGDNFTWRKGAAIVFAIGIRPCSGAIFVLIFALGQGLLWAAIASTFVMALGTAITVSTLAILAVTSRDLSVRLSGGSGSAWGRRIEAAAAIGGALFITVFGIMLFTAWLTAPVNPFALNSS